MGIDNPVHTTASPLTVWVQQQRKVRPHRFSSPVQGLRFAFYGHARREVMADGGYHGNPEVNMGVPQTS